jgi:hypothetical protein
MTELDEWLNIIRCVAGNKYSEGMSVHSLSSSFQIGCFCLQICTKYVLSRTGISVIEVGLGREWQGKKISQNFAVFQG